MYTSFIRSFKPLINNMYVHGEDPDMEKYLEISSANVYMCRQTTELNALVWWRS